MLLDKKEYDNDNELLYLISECSEEANEKIYEKYSPAIESYVKKYMSLIEGTGIDYNDLYQEGLLGLASAINNYSTNKDIKFSTFAFTCIKRKILTAIKNANRKKHSILNESFSLDYRNDDSKDSFENLIPSTSEGIDDMLVTKEKEKYFNKRINETFTDFEKEVYELKINGFTYEEIANTLGKTYKSIESALFRIRIKLKKIMEEIV